MDSYMQLSLYIERDLLLLLENFKGLHPEITIRKKSGKLIFIIKLTNLVNEELIRKEASKILHFYDQNLCQLRIKEQNRFIIKEKQLCH